MQGENLIRVSLKHGSPGSQRGDRVLPIPSEALQRRGEKTHASSPLSLAYLVTFLFAAAILPAVAQTLLATVPVGQYALYLAADPVTNKIYVANTCGNDPSCGTGPGTVTVINGLTNTVDTTVTVGGHPEFLVINPVTNKIYVSNRHDNTVSVINGATQTVIATISVGSHPTYGDINILTNRIYVVNNGNGHGTTMSVIDGHADSVVATVTVGNFPKPRQSIQ